MICINYNSNICWKVMNKGTFDNLQCVIVFLVYNNMNLVANNQVSLLTRG